jgi:hypothetical protein
MSGDPIRLSDARSKSSAALRRLIREGRSELPSGARMDAVGARLGFGPTASAGGTIHGAPKLLGATAAKVGATALLLVAGVVAGVAALPGEARHRPLSATTTTTEPRPVSTLPGPIASAAPPASSPWARVPPAASNPPSAARLSSKSAAPAAAPAADTGARTEAATPLPTIETTERPTAPAPDYRAIAPAEPHDSELALLGKAQQSVGADPLRALDLVALSTRQFPSGGLAQEREVIAIEALVRLGRRSEARARAEQFAQTYPGSAHVLRVKALVRDDMDATDHNL